MPEKLMKGIIEWRRKWFKWNDNIKRWAGKNDSKRSVVADSHCDDGTASV